VQPHGGERQLVRLHQQQPLLLAARLAHGYTPEGAGHGERQAEIAIF
jgi:hypothetical protein